MNTTRHLTHVTAFAALVAAVCMLQGRPALAAEPAAKAAAKATPAMQVVELPRVVITGRRAQPLQVVELPRVVITARRADAPTHVVQTKAAGKPA